MVVSSIGYHHNHYRNAHEAIRNGAALETLQYLLQRHPHGAMQQEKGQYPLHTVVEVIRHPEEAIQVMELICQYDPEATHRCNNFPGSLPIHFAAGDRSCPLEVLEWLLHRYPASATTTEQLGNESTPLQKAIVAQHLEAVRILLEYCPESIYISDAENQLPLHVALDTDLNTINSHANQEIIRLLVQLNSRAAQILMKTMSPTPCLPLHAAIDHRANATILELLIQANPRALHSPNILHMALFANSFTESFMVLLEKCPVEYLQSEEKGLTPLQLALYRYQKLGLSHIDMLSSKLNLDIYGMGKFLQSAIHLWGNVTDGAKLIQFWVTKYPESTQYVDEERGWRPLHYASSAAVVIPDVIQMLIQSYSLALQTRDHDGRLPLHVLLAERKTEPFQSLTLQLFLDEFSEGVSWADYEGYWPLHLACMRGLGVSIIQQLVTACPHSVMVESPNNGDIPLFSSCQALKADLDSIFFLVQRSPELFLRKSKH